MRYLDTILDGEVALLDAWLMPRLEMARTVGIRTGFLTMPGVQTVAGALASVLDRGGHVRVVAGGHGEQVDVDALKGLSETLAAGGERASLHVVDMPNGLHNAKTYFVRHDDGRSEALVGSPNLTWGGLTGSSEALVILDSRDDQADQVERVMAGIDAWVQHPSSLPVTREVLAQLAAREVKMRVLQTERVARPARTSSHLRELLQSTLVRAGPSGVSNDMQQTPTFVNVYP